MGVGVGVGVEAGVGVGARVGSGVGVGTEVDIVVGSGVAVERLLGLGTGRTQDERARIATSNRTRRCRLKNNSEPDVFGGKPHSAAIDYTKRLVGEQYIGC